MKVKEETTKAREIKLVKATLVHPSTFLPKRSGSLEVCDSVKKDGIQQPIVVRPHPTRLGEYEIIDGHNRYYGLFEKPEITRFFPGQEPEILVDIRHGLSDADVFKLSEIMHKRKNRNTYEKAQFYVKWIEAKAKELGKEEGALTAVAKELVSVKEPSKDDEIAYYFYEKELNAKQSLLSQYVKIYKMFKLIENRRPDLDIDKLKSLPLNKLYLLTKLLDNPIKLTIVVEKLLKNLDVSFDTIKTWIEDRVIEPKNHWTPQLQIKIEHDKAEELKSKLLSCFYDEKGKVIGTGLTDADLLKNGINCLIDFYNENYKFFKAEIEKDPKTKMNRIAKLYLNTERIIEEERKAKEELQKILKAT